MGKRTLHLQLLERHTELEQYQLIAKALFL